jgi:hypothetical protein
MVSDDSLNSRTDVMPITTRWGHGRIARKHKVTSCCATCKIITAYLVVPDFVHRLSSGVTNKVLVRECCLHRGVYALAFQQGFGFRAKR